MNLKAYCDAQGVPYDETPKGFRVTDATQLPVEMRGLLDEQGFAKPDGELPEPATPVEAVEGKPSIEPETEPEKPKRLAGHLPDGFPGKAAYEAAGFDTYAKVRAVRKSGEKVDGVGDKTNEAVDAIFAEEEA